jgi:hypothetical protein
MEIGLIVLVVLFLVLALGVGIGPSMKRTTRSHDDELDSIARGAHVDRQFERPRDEGNLL